MYCFAVPTFLIYFNQNLSLFCVSISRNCMLLERTNKKDCGNRTNTVKRTYWTHSPSSICSDTLHTIVYIAHRILLEFGLNLIQLFLAQILMNTFCCCFTCAHCQDNGSCSGNCITTGINALFGGSASILGSNDTFSLVDLKTFGC